MKKTLRLTKTQRKNDAYFTQSHEGCFICERKGKEFTHWKIVKNFFPYDKIASKHDLLVTKRHVGSEINLSQNERGELLKIKIVHLLKTDYDIILENLPKNQSASDHYHIHLIKLK